MDHHKASKPAFDVRLLSARRRNAIEMAFRCWADDGPFLVVFRLVPLSSIETKDLDPL